MLQYLDTDNVDVDTNSPNYKLAERVMNIALKEYHNDEDLFYDNYGETPDEFIETMYFWLEESDPTTLLDASPRTILQMWELDN